MTLRTLSVVMLSVILVACAQRTHQVDTSAGAHNRNSGVRLENFDTTIRPQDDFYRFVNGRWLAETKIPEDKSNYGSFTILADKAKKDLRDIIETSAKKSSQKQGSEAQKVGDFYSSYMDLDTIESLGLVVLQGEINKIEALTNASEISAYFAYAHKIGSDSPFGFYVNNDVKQPDTYITYFVHSGLGLPDREFYLKEDENSIALRNAYVKHIENMFVLANFDAPKKSASNIVALETKIAKAHWTRVDRRNRDLTYNLYEREALHKLAPSIDWNAFLEEAGVSDLEKTVVRMPSFFQEFNALFSLTSVESWKVYLKWKLLSSHAEILSSAFDNEHFDFYGRVLEGKEKPEERWERAVTTIDRMIGEAVGRVYVEKHFEPKAKEEMLRLVENLRTAFRESITELDWMGEETKKEAIRKLEKFRAKIGYPDEWKDYSDLSIAKGKLFENVKNAHVFYYQKEIEKLGGPIDHNEWFITPQTVNAYYNPVMNEIVFPAAILQPPFFDMNVDDAVNYGAIGGVIGHEMGHGFDDQGAKSDGDGVLRNWWTEKDLNEFKTRTSVLVDQFSQYEALPGEFLNGELTLGENIGDLGGLSIAYHAYQISLAGKTAPKLDGFTGDQRFFIGWAQIWPRLYREENLRKRLTTDVHSSSEFRVNGIVKNMPEFYSAFDVKPQDALFLPEEERVSIW